MIDNVLILGSGYIGKNLTSKLISLGDVKSVENVRQSFLNYKDEDKLREYLIKGKPNYLINASGYTGSPNVEGCENNWQDCYWMNVVVPVRIAKVCKELDIPFINIGSGFEISIGKVAELISDQMGLKLKIRSSENRVRPEKSEVERLWSDNSKAKDLLSWSPNYGQIDGFAKGIQETIEWFSIPSNLSQYKSNLYNI